jgi:hypothetical protein
MTIDAEMRWQREDEYVAQGGEAARRYREPREGVSEEANFASRVGPDLTCEVCGKQHVRAGRPTCTGHRAHSIENGDPTPCLRAPERGYTVCALHGAGGEARRELGATRAKAAGAKKTIKHLLGQRLGQELDVSPAEAMHAMVREAAGNVAFYRALVQRLGALPGDDETDAEAVQKLLGGFRYDTDLEMIVAEAHGIASRIRLESLEAAPHVYLMMYDTERDRLVKYAKLCRDAGVDEARVRIQYEQGLWLREAVTCVLDLLELTPDQRASLPDVMRRAVRQLQQPAIAPAILDVEAWEAEPSAPEPASS